MLARLLIVGLAIGLLVCSVGADLQQLGDLGTGEEGFYKHCFAKLALFNIKSSYYRHPVANSLAEDILDMDDKLVSEFSEFGGPYACSRSCFDNYVRRESPSTFEGEKQLDDSRCERFARFKRLCDLVREKNSDDSRIKAIEDWLCQTSKELSVPLYAAYFKCQHDDKYPAIYRKEANQSLESVLGYSLKQLETIKKMTAIEIEASNRKRNELDQKITKEAYSRINNGIDQLPNYIKCFKEAKEEYAREKAKNAALNQ